ncbi:hypothetical protein WDV06_24710 [Streptomyces racemochromogenes]|uniref:Uncharacterized protein n=1 Tax=Streptomyces racemochromogenes TaxID=67353 RepID=A0ABW7PIL9_9ACTN
MVTARSPRTPRSRSSAGLSQLLGLALLILGLACTHGTGGSHPATDHSTPRATTTLSARPTASTGPAEAPAPPAAGQAFAAGADGGGVTPVGAALADGGRFDAAGAAGTVGRHDPAHPVHECTPLAPRAGSAVGAPPAPAAPGEDRARAGGPGACRAARPAVPAGDTAPPPARGSSVLRV